MTSFWGYVTEGIIFQALALWWLINTSVDLIKTQQGKRELRPKLSYPWPSTRFPVEIVFKLLVALAGFFAQLAYSGSIFVDKDGNFQHTQQLLFMSIYGIFLLHAVLDLLEWLRVPVIKGSNYASAATGFFWYAWALHNGLEDLRKEEGVRRMLQACPVFLLVTISAMLFLEPLWRSSFLVSMVRAYCLQTYASWCYQTAHILHVHTPFPGSSPNPDWNPEDHRNTAIVAALFGLHLCINLVLAALTFTLTAAYLRIRHGIITDNKVDLLYGYGSSISERNQDRKNMEFEEDVENLESESKVRLLSSYSKSAC